MLILANTFFLFAFLPFVFPFAYYTDIQPTSLVVGSFLIILGLFSKRVLVTKLDIYFIFLAILSYIYINYHAEYLYEIGVASANNSLRRQIGLTFAVVVFLATKNFIHLLNFKILYTVVYLQFFFTILNIYFASIYNFLASKLIRTIKIDFTTYDGFRGYSGLSVEPAYLAGSAIAYFFIASYFWKKNRMSNIQYFLILFPCVFLLYISKSALGVVLLIILILYILFEFTNLKSVFILIFVVTTVYIFVPAKIYKNILYSEVVEDSRGMRLMQKSITDGLDSFIRDKSFIDKFVPIYVGFLSLKERPFGGGVGSYPLSVLENEQTLKDDLNACERMDLMYDRSVLPTCVTKAPSAFGLYTTEFGYLFILLLISLLFLHNRYFILSSFIKGVGLIMISNGFSITFPLIWVLFALLSADDDIYRLNYPNKIKNSVETKS